MRLFRHLLSVSLCGLSLFAASTAFAATLPEGCGDDAVQYKVKTEKVSSLPAPVAGTTQLVVIHSLVGEWPGAPVVRVAIDGSWIGAVKGRSYGAFNIVPGSHKLCVSRQGGSRADKANVEVGLIQAKAGETVYLLFTLDRQEIDALHTHAADQSLGYASPDMTAKRHETVDVTALKKLDPDEAGSKIRKLPLSLTDEK